LWANDEPGNRSNSSRPATVPERIATAVNLRTR
jgi:hypothetical protein